MRRREFVLFSSSAAAWPLVARAQPADRKRRIGVLTPFAANDPEGRARIAILQQRLGDLGWTEGNNLLIEYRWAGSDADSLRRYAAELLALGPDIIVVTGGTSLSALLQMTRTVPIVFANVPDPVGSGFVESQSRPGGNATGFMQFDYTLSGKWLGLLKELVPTVKRVAIVRDATIAFGIGQFAVAQSVAPSLGLEVSPIRMGDSAEVESAVASFARFPNGGLIVASGAWATLHRDFMVTLTARHKLPAVYPSRPFVSAGGLISYGPNINDQFRGAAVYVDRILNGEKPADMPVQAPSTYELALNLKTAKALDLEVPPTLMARADEVIE